MYPVITFPVVKLVEHKGSFMEESEVCLKFYGKVGGITVVFNVFGGLREIIKSYSLNPGDSLTITAEIKSYMNKSGAQDESYKVLAATPVPNNERAIWPTIYFPELKVTGFKKGEAKTGRYYRIYAEETLTIGGVNAKRSMVAWSDGMAEYVERLKLREGSRISAVAQGRFSLVSGGCKKLEYTLLTFSYTGKSENNSNESSQETSSKLITEAVEEVEEPAFEENIIDMPEKKEEELKPVNVKFNIDDFENMFL